MSKTQIFIIVWSLIAAFYVIYAAIFLPLDETVSHTLYDASRRWPILPFAVGVLIGHIFW
jgi:ATP/ADP translocase